MDLGDLIHDLEALSARSGTGDDQVTTIRLIEKLVGGLKVNKKSK